MHEANEIRILDGADELELPVAEAAAPVADEASLINQNKIT